MSQVGQDTLATRSTMTVEGREVAYYSLRKAGEKLGDVSRLPFSMSESWLPTTPTRSPSPSRVRPARVRKWRIRLPSSSRSKA